MACTSTIDSRPHTMGNLVSITGAFTNTDGDTGGDIDVSGLLASVVAAGANGNAAGATDMEIDGTTSTTLTLVSAANLDGTWGAMGTRA